MQCTGSILPNSDGQTSTLTVSATAAEAVAVGQLLTGSGITAGMVVLANVSAGGWTGSNEQTVTSTTVSSYAVSSSAVYVEDFIYESQIQGHFVAAGAGFFAGSGRHINTHARILALSNCCWFQNSGPLVGGEFHFRGGVGSGCIGSFNQSGSRQHKMGGQIGSSWPNIIAGISTTVDELTDAS